MCRGYNQPVTSTAPARFALDIDGVISLAQPGSAHPWYATLKADLDLDYEAIERDFFSRDFLEVLRGRLDLYVALHDYFETKGLADRLEGKLPEQTQMLERRQKILAKINARAEEDRFPVTPQRLLAVLLAAAAIPLLRLG